MASEASRHCRIIRSAFFLERSEQSRQTIKLIAGTLAKTGNPSSTYFGNVHTPHTSHRPEQTDDSRNAGFGPSRASRFPVLLPSTQPGAQVPLHQCCQTWSSPADSKIRLLLLQPWDCCQRFSPMSKNVHRKRAASTGLVGFRNLVKIQYADEPSFADSRSIITGSLRSHVWHKASRLFLRDFVDRVTGRTQRNGNRARGTLFY